MALKRLSSLVILLAALAACQAVPPADQPTEPAAPPAAETVAAPGVDYQAEPGLSPRQRLRKMIAFLEEGDPARAGVELAAYEAQVGAEGGDAETAAFWHEQIGRDPLELYEPGGEAYEVRGGETLSTIARKFLGDPLKFYMLARFNGIERPSRIEAGQTVRIPSARLVPLASDGNALAATPAVAAEDRSAEGQPPESQAELPAPALPPAPGETVSGTAVAPAEATVPETGPPADPPAPQPQASPTGTEGDVIVAAIDSAERGDMAGAIRLLEDGIARYPENPKLRQAAVLAYKRHSDNLVDRGEPEAAAVALVRALELSPDDQALAAKLQRVRDLARSQAYLQKARGLIDLGDLDAAHEALQQAVEIAPGNREAAGELAKLKETLVEQSHSQAILALRDGDFDRALALWQRVLEIDSANQTADRYYKHTLDLKQRAELAKSQQAE